MKLMQIAIIGMGITRSEFWQYTFKEFWPLYNYKYGKIEKPMTKAELSAMKKWTAGRKLKRDGNNA